MSEGDSASTAKKDPPSYVRTLRNRPFLMLWLSQLISQSGDFVFSVAILWMVLQLTGSAFYVGLVVTATILPSVVLGPVLGVYVDRWSRTRILMGVNAAEGVLVALFSFLMHEGWASTPDLLAVVLLLGAGGATVRIASSALVPQVVPVQDLTPANGLLTFSSSFNQILGLSIGGVVVSLFGVSLPVEYDALTFFVAGALILGMGGSFQARKEGVPTSGNHVWAELVEGVRFIRGQRFMLEIIALGVTVNLFANAVFALFAPYVVFVLHAGATVYGLVGAAVAAGSLVGGLVIGRVDTRRSSGHYLFGGGTVIGLSMLSVGLVNEVEAAVALLLVLGAALSITNVPITVVIQAKVPKMMLGRVMGTFGSLIMAAAPVGPLLAGWLAQESSVQMVFVAFGLVVTGVMVLGLVVMRDLREVSY